MVVWEEEPSSMLDEEVIWEEETDSPLEEDTWELVVV